MRKHLITTIICAVFFGLIASGVFLGVNHTFSDKTSEPLLIQSEAVVQDPTQSVNTSSGANSNTTLPYSDTSKNSTTDVTLNQADGNSSDVSLKQTDESSSDVSSIQTDENTSGAAQAVPADTNTLSTADIAEHTMPSMVAITNTYSYQPSGYYMLGGKEYQGVSQGTGFIIAKDGEYVYIATNAHVVANANSLSATFVDGNAADAVLLGSDETNDLAVIAVKHTNIPESTMSQIKTIEYGDSEQAAVGDEVIAIGNALGYGQSVSKGVISALNRNVEVESGIAEGLIQTDAAINPGNSGGVLLNTSGKLIGINSAKYADDDVEGMGFAIPIDYALPILESLMNNPIGTDSTNSTDTSDRGLFRADQTYSESDESNVYTNPGQSADIYKYFYDGRF